MPKYQHLISKGLIQPLNAIPFHHSAPFTRRLMVGKEVHQIANKHIAVHEIRNLQLLDRSYSDPHRHNVSELNMLLSLERLVFRITLGDEIYIVDAPASIHIPPGILHSANAIEGSGFYIVILDSNEYEASIVAPSSETEEHELLKTNHHNHISVSEIGHQGG